MIGIGVSIILYLLYILYSNKAHQIFMFKDIGNNDLLSRYDAITRTIIGLFTFCIHLLGYYMFSINRQEILKGMRNLALIDTSIFIFCFGLEKAFNYYRSDIIIALIQFLVISVSTLLLYLICHFFHSVKVKLFSRSDVVE